MSQSKKCSTPNCNNEGKPVTFNVGEDSITEILCPACLARLKLESGLAKEHDSKRH